MNEIVNKILKVIVGLTLAVGSLLAWKFWDINPGLAVLVGIGGLGLVGSALDFDFDFPF